VCRQEDRAGLQRLVFNMHDSNVVKFDEVIHHNNMMDSHTRRALYSNIRRQIAHNFEVANKKNKSAICRYCRVSAGPLNEYVAFVVFSETDESVVDTSASRDETVLPSVDNNSVKAETNVDMEKTASEGCQSEREVSKTTVDYPVDIKSESHEVLSKIKQCEILGEITPCKPAEKQKREMLHVSRVRERKSKNVTTSRLEVTQTAGTGEESAQTQVGHSVQVSEREGPTQKVVDEIVEQETYMTKTSAMLGDEVQDVKRDDEPCVMSQPDEKVVDGVVEQETYVDKTSAMLVDEVQDVDPGDVPCFMSQPDEKVVDEMVEQETTTVLVSEVQDVEPDDELFIVSQPDEKVDEIVDQEAYVNQTSAVLVDEVQDVEPDDEPCVMSQPDEKVVDEMVEQKTTAVLVSEVQDVEPDDELFIVSQPDEMDVMNEHDLPKHSADEILMGKILSLPRDNEVNIEAKNQTNDLPEMDASGELYVWQTDTILQGKSDTTSDDVDLKNTEYEKLLDWLSSRTDSTTAFHRFPTLYDLPVLAPRENTERSVTWRLAEKFVPSKSATERGLTTRNRFGDEGVAGGQMSSDRRAASDVIFIGPYDTSMIRQIEVVRRRVSQVCHDMLPLSSSDIFCVTDVGCDINLTSVSDIVNTSRVSTAQFTAYTASNTKSACVSCVLLRFPPPIM